MVWWLAATVASVLLGMPQAARTLRTRSVTGLHWFQDVVRVLSKGLWLGYAVAVADALFAFSQVITALPSVVVIVLLWRLGGVPKAALVTATSLTFVAAVAMMAAGPVLWVLAVGHLLAGSDVVRYLPQATLTFRADSLHGVAVGTYIAQVVASVCWAAYGLQAGLWPLVWSNAVILPIAVLIWVRVVLDQRRAALEADEQGLEAVGAGRP